MAPIRTPTPGAGRKLAIVAIAAMTAACDAGPTPPDPGPTQNGVAVSFAGGTLKAELAATRAARELGLMNRTTIAADSGMLFVWAANQSHQAVAFHMVNTHVDLSIAFLDGDRTVLNVEEMTRNTTTLHFAVAPFRYALEAPRGWFTARGIGPGAVTTFTLPAGVIIEP